MRSHPQGISQGCGASRHITECCTVDLPDDWQLGVLPFNRPIFPLPRSGKKGIIRSFRYVAGPQSHDDQELDRIHDVVVIRQGLEQNV
jgi:hypothetical protein